MHHNCIMCRIQASSELCCVLIWEAKFSAFASIHVTLERLTRLIDNIKT